MNKKITELTKEQEDKFDFFVDKWTKIGLDTSRPNYDEVLAAVPQYYKEGELDPPEKVVFADSIWAALVIGCLLKEGHEIGQDISEKEKRKAINNENLNYIWSSRVGTSLWSGYNSWRDYMGFIGVNISELAPTFILAKNSCYVFPFEKTLIVAEKPCSITLNQNGDLHHESKMAIEWPDGFGMYCLNGVRMCGAEWFFDASIPDNEKAKKIIALENVEQRAEASRVFGYAKLAEHLDKKVIHVGKNGYEVWTLNVGTGRPEEFLKMVNPSTGEIHVECVGKGVRNEDEALASRWPESMRAKYGYRDAMART